jgi:hypothetical protein
MCGIFCSLHVGCCGDTDDIHCSDRPNYTIFHELSERLKVANAARGVFDAFPFDG